jgi:hypothetical protein
MDSPQNGFRVSVQPATPPGFGNQSPILFFDDGSTT